MSVSCEVPDGMCTVLPRWNHTRDKTPPIVDRATLLKSHPHNLVVIHPAVASICALKLILIEINWLTLFRLRQKYVTIDICAPK